MQVIRQIVTVKNGRIAHEYDNISDEVIWTIILKELPALKEEVKKLQQTKQLHRTEYPK